MNLLWIHNSLVSELIHPFIAHHKPSFSTHCFAPAVLDSPSHRLLVDQMHRCQHHCVSHGRFPGLKALCFAHSQANVEAELVVDQVGIHNAPSAVGEFADIAAKEDRDPCTEHGDTALRRKLALSKPCRPPQAYIFHCGHIDVYIANGAETDNIAKPAYAEELFVLVPWVIDKAEEFIDVST